MGWLVCLCKEEQAGLVSTKAPVASFDKNLSPLSDIDVELEEICSRQVGLSTKVRLTLLWKPQKIKDCHLKKTQAGAHQQKIEGAPTAWIAFNLDFILERFSLKFSGSFPIKLVPHVCVDIVQLCWRGEAPLCKWKGLWWNQTDWSLIYNLRLMVRNTLEVQAPPNKQTNSQTVCPYHWLSSRTNSKNWREKSFIAACPLSCHIQEKKKLPFPPFIKEDNV